MHGRSYWISHDKFVFIMIFLKHQWVYAVLARIIKNNDRTKHIQILICVSLWCGSKIIIWCCTIYDYGMWVSILLNFQSWCAILNEKLKWFQKTLLNVIPMLNLFITFKIHIPYIIMRWCYIKREKCWWISIVLSVCIWLKIFIIHVIKILISSTIHTSINLKIDYMENATLEINSQINTGVKLNFKLMSILSWS